MLMTLLLILLAAPQSERKLAEDHYQKGTAFFRTGRFSDALTEFQEAVRKQRPIRRQKAA